MLNTKVQDVGHCGDLADCLHSRLYLYDGRILFANDTQHEADIFEYRKSKIESRK